MKASEVYTGYGARNIIWPAVADGFERASGGSHSFSKSAGLTLRTASSEGVVV
jgi:hypothetical protein